MHWLADPQAWAALATLTVLEIVLGIDNIIFISILVGRLPEHQRQRARMIGLGLAMLSRIALLFSLAWVMTLTRPLFSVFAHGVSGRDLILLGGGLFLLAKSSMEIHGALEVEEHGRAAAGRAGYWNVLGQILVLDLVFSLDSVITAVGLARQLWVMVTAIVLAVLVMMVAARAIGDFVDRHPTVKMLALSFLILIGAVLVADGAGFHVPRGYIYFATAFSTGVELLNLRLRRKAPPVHLRNPRAPQEAGP